MFFVVKINVMLHIQLDKRGLLLQVLLGVSFKALNSMDVMAQQRNASDVLYYATLLNVIKRQLFDIFVIDSFLNMLYYI